MNEDKITPESFQEAYGDMLLDGLSSNGTYIPLRTNKRLGINVSIRPYVLRVTDTIVLFGGKLRVGYTIEDGKYAKTKIEAINSKARVEQLKNFCKGFSWQKIDDRRMSTMVGFGVAGGDFDGASARVSVEEDGLAAKLIKDLESKYSQYNDDASFTSVRKVASALNDAWMLQSQAVYSDAVNLPPSVVGQQTGLLNQAQDKYHDNVVSFQDKVNELATAATAEPSDD